MKSARLIAAAVLRAGCLRTSAYREVSEAYSHCSTEGRLFTDECVSCGILTAEIVTLVAVVIGCCRDNKAVTGCVPLD